MNVIENMKHEYNIRLVSMPCSNLFDIQENDYKELILPKNIKKVSIEAGSTMGWYKYVDFTYGVDTFGASGNPNDLKKYYGFNTESISVFLSNLLKK